MYNIRNGHSIPYFDHGNKIGITIHNSARRRNMSPIVFALRKIRNILFYKWAYMCPLNSWRLWLHRHRGVTIGKNVYIGQRCIIDNAYPEYVYIEDNASIAGGVTIVAHANPYAHFRNVVEASVEPVVLKEGAWIGEGAILLRGVTVGKNAIVSAGTVVDKNVPNCSLAQGNPMKIVAEYGALMR